MVYFDVIISLFDAFCLWAIAKGISDLVAVMEEE